MKNQRRFKAPNYSRGCLLAKGIRSLTPQILGSALRARRGGQWRFQRAKAKSRNAASVSAKNEPGRSSRKEDQD